MRKFFKQYLAIMVMGIAVVISSASLMVVSQNVYDKQSKIKRMEQQALATEWEIRALNAEMAFLSRPDRLDQLASAMANSISPATGADLMVIAPVSYTPFTQTDLSIIPNRKPAISKALRVSTPIIKTSPTPTKTTQNFDSFLDKIGGSE